MWGAHRCHSRDPNLLQVVHNSSGCATDHWKCFWMLSRGIKSERWSTAFYSERWSELFKMTTKGIGLPAQCGNNEWSFFILESCHKKTLNSFSQYEEADWELIGWKNMEGKDLYVMMEEISLCFSNLILHIAKIVWKK